MDKLIDSIIKKEFKEAESSLREELASLVEKKLGEKKKMMVAGESPFKTEVERTGSVKAQRKPLKGVTKVLKDIKEAMVSKDGLVHLNTGEAVLPSVYRQRRWLAESNEWSDWMADTYHDLKDHKDKNVKHHVRMAMAQHKKGNTEDAHEHMKAAQAAAHKLATVKEDSKADDKHFKKQDKKKQDMLNSLMRRGHSYGEAKEKLKLKEDCGLAPDKEALIHAAMEKAKMLLQPQLDTTAPRVDRTKVSIPKGTRPADRLTAPDLGPKEDEWMLGKKLDEAVSRKHFRDVANLLREIPDEKKRKELAHHHAGIFAGQNPRFDKKKFFAAAGVKLDEGAFSSGAVGGGAPAGFGVLVAGAMKAKDMYDKYQAKKAEANRIGPGPFDYKAVEQDPGKSADDGTASPRSGSFKKTGIEHLGQGREGKAITYPIGGGKERKYLPTEPYAKNYGDNINNQDNQYGSVENTRKAPDFGRKK